MWWLRDLDDRRCRSGGSPGCRKEGGDRRFAVGPGQATPTGENLTTGAYTDWRFWGRRLRTSRATTSALAGGSSISIATRERRLTRSNVRGNSLSGTFTRRPTGDQLSATFDWQQLSDLDTSSPTRSPAPATVAIKVTFPASTTVKNGKIVSHWQSDNGPGKPVDVVFHLSDASAADVTKTITSVDFNPSFTEFGFSWNAAANGQTMSVTIKMNASSGTGNVGVQVAMWA
jgi:hypothetical protein